MDSPTLKSSNLQKTYLEQYNEELARSITLSILRNTVFAIFGALWIFLLFVVFKVSREYYRIYTQGYRDVREQYTYRRFTKGIVWKICWVVFIGTASVALAFTAIGRDVYIKGGFLFSIIYFGGVLYQRYYPGGLDFLFR